MFSRADEIIEIFDSLTSSLSWKAHINLSTCFETLDEKRLADIAQEARADLSRHPRGYTLLNMCQSEGDENPQIVLGAPGIVSLPVDNNIGYSFSRGKSHIFLRDRKFYVARLGFGRNRILVDGKVLRQDPAKNLKLARAIDHLVDAYTTCLTAGDGYWPSKGNSSSGKGYQRDAHPNAIGVTSHDCPCVVNPTSQQTYVLMRIVYEDGTKPVEYGWVMEPHSSLHARLDLITDVRGRPILARDKTYSVVMHTDNPSLDGVMSRAWSGEEGVVDAFMSASLARVDLPLSDRVLASQLKRRVDAARENFCYKE